MKKFNKLFMLLVMLLGLSLAFGTFYGCGDDDDDTSDDDDDNNDTSDDDDSGAECSSIDDCDQIVCDCPNGPVNFTGCINGKCVTESNCEDYACNDDNDDDDNDDEW